MSSPDSPVQQLATARRLAAQYGVDEIEWVHGDAENVPQPDGSFDLASSEAVGVHHWVDAMWAQSFPAEQAWILVKR